MHVNTLKHTHTHTLTHTQTHTGLTGEAHEAGADVAAGHVFAGPSVHTGVGLTLVGVEVTVLPTPARVTKTLVTEDDNGTGSKFSFRHLFICQLCKFACNSC